MSVPSKLRGLRGVVRDGLLTHRMLGKLRVHQEVGGPPAIMVATPRRGNLGDQAITCAQGYFLADRLPSPRVSEVQRYRHELAREVISHSMCPGSLVVVSSGDSVGALWPEENAKINNIVSRFHGYQAVVFPQTAIFAAITGTPRVALDNASGGVSRGAAWLGYLSNVRVMRHAAEAPAFFDETLAAGPVSYGRPLLDPWYDEVEGVSHCVVG
jgi:hypothetical protein